MKIYITGVSGAGKTSLARALTTRGVNAIDLDEISHWENKETKEVVGWEAGANEEWMSNHAWVCDMSKLKEGLALAEHSVLCGHASNQDEYMALFDKTFVLNCLAETIMHRLATRTDNDFGKHPDDLARILNWNKGFTDWMVGKGAAILDGEKPLNDLVDEIIAELK